MKKQRITLGDDSPSLTNRAYQKIFQGIINGEIPGGTRLVALELARQIGTSITPIREALLRLAVGGLVKPIPRFGYVVETISETEVIDLFDARIGIERLVASLAVENITTAEIDLLENNVEEMNQAIQRGRAEDIIGLDITFHRSIAQAAHNKTILSVNQLLLQNTYRYRYACLRIMDIAQSTRDGHVKIVKAFKERKADKVDHAMLAHLGEIKNAVSAYLEQLRHQSPSLVKMDL
jgi:DNA-binding GntR family transcriptional regulator